MNALEVLCPICGAKPGWPCFPAPDAQERLTRPHWLRQAHADEVTLGGEG